jgi:predicted choloylglycine hydrolase
VRRTLTSLALLLLLAATWVVCVHHMAVYPAPPAERTSERPEVVAQSRFLPRAEAGLNNLVVFGSPYERGLATGRLTRGLIAEEEADLVAELNRFFPNPFLRRALMVAAMRWFWGIERYFPEWSTDEMYGVAQSAPHEEDTLADPFTRQIAYHGVHEIGQMFVDFDRQDFGCTAIGVPWRSGWLVGRNFDFEAVRLLDTEKLAKWEFPDAGGGHAYLSVTWAGMVGAVTGVNEKGVYVSINAAGTADFRRHGTPTTLVALKALQEADTAHDAVRIIEAATTFISDIFVVADRTPGELYVVEKTPKRVAARRIDATLAVTNHMTAPEFRDDPINEYRMREQTTVMRLERAEELVRRWRADAHQTPRDAAAAMTDMLRDKRGVGGKVLHLGHRNALDALIATHSVVYSAPDRMFWISQGPALAGPYIGYDLEASFRERRPVGVESLPPDDVADATTFAELRAGLARLREAKGALAGGRCPEAREALGAASATPARDHYEVLMSWGDYYKSCGGDLALARTYWTRALDATPAYSKHRHYLREVLQ